MTAPGDTGGVVRPPSLLFALLLVAGCANPRDGRVAEPLPPTVGPVVMPNPGRKGDDERDKREVASDEEAWSDKWDLASRYAAAGYDDEALAVIDAALMLGPPARWNTRLRGLKESLRARRAEATLRVEARGVQDYAQFGAAVDWVLRVRNASTAPVVLPARPAAASGAELTPSVFFLTIRRRDLDIYSSELRRSWTQTVFLQRPGEGEIRIAPGGVHEMPVRIPGGDAGGPLSGLRILELEGTFRPAGGPEGVALDRVPIRRGRVVVLPDGFEPLARDPLGSMEHAVDAVAPPHLLVAAEFVGRQDLERAVVVVARALAEGDPALRTAASSALALLRERSVGRPVAPFAEPLIRALELHPERGEDLVEALRAVSGVPLASDARIWREWWKRMRDSGATIAPPEPGPEEPR